MLHIHKFLVVLLGARHIVKLGTEDFNITILWCAEVTLRTRGYFNYKGMQALSLNPVLEDVRRETKEQEVLPLEGVSAQRGKMLTVISWVRRTLYGQSWAARPSICVGAKLVVGRPQ